MVFKEIEMSSHMELDLDRVRQIAELKVAYLKGELGMDRAQEEARKFGRVSGQEFALSEQYMGEYGISDYELTERIDELLKIFEAVRVYELEELVPGHPIHTYLLEVEAIGELLGELEAQLDKKFIKNQWLEIYDKLEEVKKHFARKQNQLYPMLEKKGFDKPTKVMWSLEDLVEDHLRRAKASLVEDKEDFLSLQPKLIQLLQDMMDKEVEILFPTALKLLGPGEFSEMRRGDDEIGYCLIDPPAGFSEGEPRASEESGFIKELASLLKKYGVASGGDLDVSRGKLSLEQINLIFKHMKIDLSYVDENDIVRFYTDTDHRVFPRSPGVIGRHVTNCHPKESLGPVTQIVELFRAGLEDEADFWIDTGEKFIYINFTAVRDDEGKFRGVLEMMQDVTYIRSLQGSQRLASWSKKD